MSEPEEAELSLRAYVHGLDLVTGAPLRPPKSWDQLRECVCATFGLGGGGKRSLPGQPKMAERTPSQRRGQPPADVLADDLESAGWGVLFAADAPRAVRMALEPLLRNREGQSGRRFRVFAGAEGLRRGQGVEDWLLARGLTPDGPTNPDRVPYYLLIVGTPAEIPFAVDFDLGRQLAVGRIGFGSVLEYEQYAKNVVDSERISTPARRWAMVATAHADDGATQGSRKALVSPLLETHGQRPGWDHLALLDGEATKSNLSELLRDGPSLLFYAGHGLGSAGRDEQLDRVGAILCADWPGPRGWIGPLPEEHYLAARDLDPAWDLRGMVAVLFGCHTAGQPRRDSFCLEPPRILGAEDRISPLASRMLGRRRGALAVLGHLDRAWSFSYRWRGMAQPRTFGSVLTDLLEGCRIGYAFRHLGERHHLLSVRSARLFQNLSRGRDVEPNALVDLFVAEQDARSYLLLGDPAVRLPTP
ncbi:MAG: C25 family cysteine peptidase [Holophagales bacterium]|nr:C25 family cysteine peptidase [Holophagales bacterium]